MFKKNSYCFIILLLFIIGCSTLEKKLDYFSLAEKSYLKNNFKEAIYYYSKYINSTSEQDSNYFKALLKKCECYDRCAEINGMVNTYRLIDSLFRIKTELKKYNFDYFFISGLYNYNNHNYSKALTFFQDAIKCKSPIDTSIIFILHKIGACYQKQGNINAAEKYFINGLNLSRNKKIKFSNEFMILYNSLAYINLKYYNDFFKAGLYYDSVLYVANNCKYLDSVEYAWNLRNIGHFYDLTGVNNKADFYIAKAYNIYSKLNLLNEDVANLLLLQVYINGYNGKFEIAHNKISRALDIFAKKHNFFGLQRTYVAKAYLYYLNKDHQNALKYYKIALDFNSKHNLPEKESILNNIAWCYSGLNITDSADSYYKRSISIIKSKTNSLNINTFITLYGEYSRMLISVSKYSEALKIINSSINVVSNTIGKNNTQYGYFIYWKALALENMKEFNSSLIVYQEVIKTSLEKDIKNDIYDVSNIKPHEVVSSSNVIDALIGKAGIFGKLSVSAESKERQVYLLQKSLEHYQKASELVGYFNKRIISENDRLSYISSKRHINELEVFTAMKIYRATGESRFLEAAFNSADQNKAVQLALELKDDEYKVISNVPDGLIKKEKAIQEDLAYYKRLLSEENNKANPDIAKTNLIQNKISHLIDETELLNKYIETTYPKYNLLKYSDKSFSLKNIINENNAIIEYSFSEDSLYIFIISNNQCKVLSSPSRELENKVYDYRKMLSSINDTDTYKHDFFINFYKTGFDLYCKLLKLAIPYVSSKNIIIIPDGVLNIIPFEALITKYDSSVREYRKLPYFLYDYSVSYSYSAALYSIQQKNIVNNRGEIIAFGPEYRNTRIINSNDTLFLSTLNSKQEIYDIKKIIKGNVYYGKKASKTNFKKIISDEKIVHLAMHAIIDNEHPENSKLFFNPNSDSAQDFSLNSYELYNLNMRTPLLVLNACNTGNGKLVKGEGLLSIARGFAYAGCPSMVITQWDAADNSSIKLMKNFYENLKKNYQIDKSLQLAKINFIQNSDNLSAHPYFWAGFIQTGKTDSLHISKSLNYTTLTIYALSGLILLFFGCWYVKCKYDI